MTPEQATAAFETVVLERKQVGAMSVLSGVALEDVRMAPHMLGRVADGMLAQIRASVMTHGLERQTVEAFTFVPETWVTALLHTIGDNLIDHFRLRRLGIWFKSRGKMQRRRVTVEVEAFAAFPESTYTFPRELGRPQYIRLLGEPRWDGEPW